jgi:succinate dehydrogenase/fumarate reductase iron-sulfur protein
MKMKARFDIFRKKPLEREGTRQEYEVEVRSGDVILDVFHRIQASLDPAFAYRYSCRGAICGSCAVRVNGTAALACKTRAAPLAEKGVVRIDPLCNMTVIKDLVCDFAPFWEAYARVRPFLERKEDAHDVRMKWEDTMSAAELDQLKRSIDCIKCAACFSDCPRRTEDDGFIGPAACVELYRFFVDPRDGTRDERRAFAGSPGGVLDCDRHARCVKVCPKDVRPLRAITFMRRSLEVDKENPGS